MSDDALMFRTYKYRLYPRKAEVRALETMLEQGREVYNGALAECKQYYQATGNGIWAMDQRDYFREWRKQDGILLNATSLNLILRRLDKAYAAFFRRVRAGETPGYPRFKPPQRFNSLDYTYGNGCKLNVDKQTTLYVQNVGDIKVKFHRPLPQQHVIKQANIKRCGRKWFVCLMMECEDLRYGCQPQPEVGIDVGLHKLLALSDGQTLDNPRWLRSSLAELRVAQRRLFRRKRGSNRRRKAAQQVALLHERIAWRRRDFWHKVTRYLVGTYDVIAIEDMKLAFITHNEHLALSAHDAGLGMFRQFLEYKAESAGTRVIAVAPHYTSQTCSGCGVIVEKDLSVRIHDCPHCGVQLDRDVNAARNILFLAL
ncbi:MAG: transposase, partial [Chloroflexota bacterium]|nr:transposase [Chloroflexota bacterium]